MRNLRRLGITITAVIIGLLTAAVVFCAGSALLWPLTAEAKEVKLKWKKIDGAKTYKIEVSTDTSFSTKILEKSLTETVLPFDLKSGTYYLRVQGTDKLGRDGSWSKPFKLVVTAPIAPPMQSDLNQKVSYISKSPKIETGWKAQDKASTFKVVVKKDGKEILTKETSSPKIDFSPSEPGNYKVEVSSGVDHVYGPAVTVQQVEVEKKELAPPKWEMPAFKKYTSKKPVEFKWKPVEGVETYRVLVYEEPQNGARSPSSEKPKPKYVLNVPAADFKEHGVMLPQLPPGRYSASVESVAGEGLVAPSTSYQFDVKRAKPVDFEKFDLNFTYTITPIKYQESLPTGNSGNSFSQGSSLGGRAQMEGNLWLSDSDFGVKASGSWGGFTLNNTILTYNDLVAAAQYRWTLQNNNGMRTAIKPYLGSRTWTIPIIVPSQASQSNCSGSNCGNSTQQVLNPTLVGALAGVEVVRPMATNWALTGQLQLAVPFTTLGFLGGQSLTVQQNPSTKVGVGAKIALPGSLRLLAMAGYQEEKLSFGLNGQNSGSTNSSSSSSNGGNYVSASSPYVMLGVESSDEGPMFGSIGDKPPRPERFSDFVFSSKYVVLPMHYASTISENPGQSSNIDMQYAGALDMEFGGWFKDSHQGLKAQAEWSGFTYKDSSISYPEMSVQWGYRPLTSSPGYQMTWANFVGLRSWRAPIITQNGGTPNQYNVTIPQLLSPSDTFVVSKKISATWDAKLQTQLSTPIYMVDKDGSIDHLVYGVFSSESELSAMHTFSPDLSAGLGLGYRYENFQYVPTQNQSAVSRVQITAPSVSLFGTYFF